MNCVHKVWDERGNDKGKIVANFAAKNRDGFGSLKIPSRAVVEEVTHISLCPTVKYWRRR